MKKSILFTSVISAILFFVGIVFKHQHWPGASVLIILGAAIGIAFLVMYLMNAAKLLQSGMEKTNGILAVITMMIILIGFTFKFQHWPGGRMLLYVSHVSLLISSILMFVDAFSETDKAKQSLKGLFAFIYVILMSILAYLAIFFNGFQPSAITTGLVG